MSLIDKMKAFRDIESTNLAVCHKDIDNEAKEIIRTRWTKPCQICGEIDYEVIGTRIESDCPSLAHVICCHCGVSYVMCPVSLRKIENERLKEQTEESKTK